MGKFKAGQSGNPRGKPRGALNQTTKAGNVVALRLCLERLLPPRKDRPISLKLPKLEGVADIPKALEAVLKAVAEGEITPVEGQAVASMIETYRKGVDLADMEARLMALEAVLKGRKSAHDKSKSGKTL